MTEPSSIVPLFEALPPRVEGDKAAIAEQLANEISAAAATAKKASKESLIHYRTIGDKLNEAKDLLGYGGFGTWAESHGFKPEWRRLLMKLAENWSVVEAYLETSDEPDFGYGVRAICKLIDRHLARCGANADNQQVPADEQATVREKAQTSPAERVCSNRSAAIASGYRPHAEPEEPSQPGAREAQQSRAAILAEENARLAADLTAAKEQIEALRRERDELSGRCDALEAEVAALKANEAKFFTGEILPQNALDSSAQFPPTL
ncbi:uncharacterized small protein (DUF1192 family) [Rhodoblastus acidophilus]|uniref:DUF3450 domain-containing protein n=1 Tax=Rhodoblastus acidophilus TaxID=1074 RepID=UPI002224FF72|nr:DUF3450 domain-containing protein [Rhodoblastus acidophilus]MCW2286087.1 uncharacterized small protein (DUF1192 family) [Rhodoblastus acidophilus]MCW2334981.1 uncharacterized small protein (DUF1192 family) [Rhodoblastus acidophilus]